MPRINKLEPQKCIACQGSRGQRTSLLRHPILPPRPVSPPSPQPPVLGPSSLHGLFAEVIIPFANFDTSPNTPRWSCSPPQGEPSSAPPVALCPAWEYMTGKEMQAESSWSEQSPPGWSRTRSPGSVQKLPQSLVTYT